ncbi:hypothetical protein IFR05_006687 [Cadophora sp. M221]|nr:hypothetical protein IFR05_006687 [Cadophora sp. M221]
MARNPGASESSEIPNLPAGPANDNNTTNPTSEADAKINDRFTTHWCGPCHPAALEYAASHNISYRQPIHSFSTGPGHPRRFMTFGGGGGIDLNALRAANLAHDEEFRQRARVDTEFHTCTSLTSIQLCEDVSRLQEELVVLGFHNLACSNGCPTKAFWRRNIDWTALKIPQLEELLKLVDELEQLVLDEKKPNWDWETGIEAQMKLGGEMYATFVRTRKPPSMRGV